MSNISRIFITHMHADHTLGLVAVLTTIMSGVTANPQQLEKYKQQGLAKKVCWSSGVAELISQLSGRH